MLDPCSNTIGISILRIEVMAQQKSVRLLPLSLHHTGKDERCSMWRPTFNKSLYRYDWLL